MMTNYQFFRTMLKEHRYLILVLSLLVFSSFMPRTRDISYETAVTIVKEKDEFTPEKLKAYLQELNIRFPDIVYAQAVLETGNFKSAVFLENHNLFGMKQAQRRATTANGTDRKHAYYKNWRESVLDYALYQNRYLYELNTRSEYYQYLDATYAEISDYSDRVKRIVEEIR